MIRRSESPWHRAVRRRGVGRSGDSAERRPGEAPGPGWQTLPPVPPQCSDRHPGPSVIRSSDPMIIGCRAATGGRVLRAAEPEESSSNLI
eukprot:751807-Hanusia_phi.AAC.1